MINVSFINIRHSSTSGTSSSPPCCYKLVLLLIEQCNFVDSIGRYISTAASRAVHYLLLLIRWYFPPFVQFVLIMLLALPDFTPGITIGAILLWCVIGYILNDRTRIGWFVGSNDSIYLKSGEYGEYQQHLQDSAPPAWKEPWNAFTSFAYSVFGTIILFIGISDWLHNWARGDGIELAQANILMNHGVYSMLFGCSLIYLGVSSFMFHATHSEYWRKRDAGMTCGVMAFPIIWGICDRIMPVAVSQSAMILCGKLCVIANITLPSSCTGVFNINLVDYSSHYVSCLPRRDCARVLVGFVLQISLTDGYVPYGSSDIVLPAFVATVFGLELLPVFGSVVDVDQWPVSGRNTIACCCTNAVASYLLRVMFNV
jgi:hypothetical protein